MGMIEKVLAQNNSIRDVRMHAHILLDLLFEHRTMMVQKGEMGSVGIDKFVLVSSLGRLFGSVRVCVGHVYLVRDVNEEARTVSLLKKEHYWLASRLDPSHIVDVLPYGGALGISVPQVLDINAMPFSFVEAVQQRSQPWYNEKEMVFQRETQALTALLISLQTRIPL